jgi:hypothetical protein
MFNNFSVIFTLLLVAYVLYIIINNGFDQSIKEGFNTDNESDNQDYIARDPPKYDPNDPDVFNKPYDESKIIDGNDKNISNLRKPINHKLNNIITEPSYLGRPYRLDKKSILKQVDDNENKYLKKEMNSLENLNFLYPKNHSQTDFSGIHSRQKNVNVRSTPLNPRSDQKPLTIKLNKIKSF